MLERLKMTEQCIWRELLSGGNDLYKKYSNKLCNICPGYNSSCKSYLSNKEIDKRQKEKELEECLRTQ
jgi:hypothetical protein